MFGFIIRKTDYDSFQVNLDGLADSVAEITELLKRRPEALPLSCHTATCLHSLKQKDAKFLLSVLSAAVILIT